MSNLTKKDYELIANQFDMELFQLRHEYDTGEVEAVERLAKRLATRLQMDNPKFDRDKFLTACGIEQVCDECGEVHIFDDLPKD